MLDLQRHIFCPIWNTADKTIDTSFEGTVSQWTGLKYSCQKVLETYCKIFNQQELLDLIVRYI